MNINKRICVSYKSAKTLILLEEHDSISSVIAASLQKLKLPTERSSNYHLVLERFDCMIESVEEMRDNDVVILRQHAESSMALDGDRLDIETDNVSNLNDEDPETFPVGTSRATTRRKVQKSKENPKSRYDAVAEQFDEELKDGNDEYLSDHHSSFNSKDDSSYDDFSEEYYVSEDDDMFDEGEDNRFNEDEDDRFNDSEDGRINQDERYSLDSNSKLTNDVDGDKSKKEDYEEVRIEEIKENVYASRQVLQQEVDRWAVALNFRVRYDTAEKYLTKEDCMASTLICSEKNCPFYLRYKTDGKNGPYKLSDFWNLHNHKLSRNDNGRDVSPEIYKRIKDLKDNVKDCVKLTAMINEEYDKKFSVETIRHQVRKIKDELYGIPSKDAQTLLTLLANDAEERGYFFKEQTIENQLCKICFMTLRMIQLANMYADVLILDTTHKTNRFNLPLLDIIVVDNLGRSCTIFVGLLNNQTIESFVWALEAFRENLNRQPNLILSDEDEALLSGIFVVFPSLYFKLLNKSFLRLRI